jgi:pyruvate dehydrogenase E2 component (dihydrolipoamide acetyltransferase)
MVPHVRWTTPIMVPGQTAILGVGALAQRPTVHGGRVEARWNIPLSLSFDHRAVNGDPASRFLSDVIDLLADPDGGWLENS